MVLVAYREEVVGAVELQLRAVNNKAPGFFLDGKPAKPYVANLCVLPRCRRQGVAQALLDAVEYVADLWGHDSIFLHVSPANDAALRLYARNQYETIPDWPPRFLNQLVYLYKPLRPSAPTLDTIVKQLETRR